MEAKFNNGAVPLLNDLMEKAATLEASDIHIEPNAFNVRVRYRVDGLLMNGLSIHRSMHQQLISRIKIIAGLDISEQRLPQDGRSFIKVGSKEYDLRVSVVPTFHGEKAVIRLLEKNKMALPLSELGMAEEDLEYFERSIERPQGMIIVCGPTGCGKTTTLYSSLEKINRETINIVTIEDPVEYQLNGINQMHVNQKTGLTFAKGLRGILRQDPDVIMVGEIRDFETAQIAVQAAMTGHLVFSTLHTNDAAGAECRLKDMGVDPYLISSTVNCVVSQRLVRKLCANCGGRGCRTCGNAGYKGRTGVFEVLKLKPRSSAFKSLKDHAEEMVKAGVTSAEEVARSVYVE